LTDSITLARDRAGGRPLAAEPERRVAAPLRIDRRLVSGVPAPTVVGAAVRRRVAAAAARVPTDEDEVRAGSSPHSGHADASRAVRCPAGSSTARSSSSSAASSRASSAVSQRATTSMSPGSMARWLSRWYGAAAARSSPCYSPRFSRPKQADREAPKIRQSRPFAEMAVIVPESRCLVD
jgi:hypothetical protein